MTLEAIPLFRLLDRNELQALRLISQECRFTAGQTIFEEGAPGDGVYFVKSGLVEISSGVAERRVFSRLGPGEFFGEMAVIEHRPRSASASAAQDTEVFFLPRGEMLTFIEHSPALSFALLQQISRRLRDFNRLHVQEMIQTETLAVIGRFAQGVVHDLKNPLNLISLSADAFDRPDLTPAQRREIQLRVHKQVDRISDLVSDILIFTKSATSAELKPGDYGAWVEGILGDLQAEAELKGARLELATLPPALPVRFDPHQLNRVFFNLIHNATDVMPEGGTIYLRFELTGGEIVTEIEDTGPGIAPEVAGKLFQPFATHGKEHGTGLGLSICKKIVENHGGRIAARSEAGHGAIFAFSLPLLQ